MPLLAVSILLGASQKGPTTTLTHEGEPSLRQIRLVKVILDEALKLKGKEFSAKLDRARQFLAKGTGKTSFGAEIWCMKEKQFTDQETHCYTGGGLEDVCYKGDPREAVKLIQLALAQDFWNWDEEWIENPRLDSSGKEIHVTLVDGPNEDSALVKIPACR